jgi:hypothetical protein
MSVRAVSSNGISRAGCTQRAVLDGVDKDFRPNPASDFDVHRVPNASSKRKDQQKQLRLAVVDHHYRRLFTVFRWSIGGWRF